MAIPEFLPAEYVGIPVKQVCSFHSLALEYKGKKVLCQVVNGHSAVFNLIDLESKEIVLEKPLIGAESSWQMIRHKDSVYIAGTGDFGCFGHLYSLSLSDLTFKNHGVVAANERFLWSITTDNERYLYIGTWPGGKIIRFDVETEDFFDFGTIVPKQDYLRSLAYLNGYLYAGVGPQGSLVKIEPNTLEKAHLEDGALDILGLDKESLPFCYELKACDPYVLAFFSTEKKELLAYNTKTDSWHYLTDNYQGMMVEDENGDIFYTTKKGLFRFLRNTGQSELIDSSFTASFKGGGIIDKKLYSVFFNGNLLQYNISSKLTKTQKTPAKGQATQIQTIFMGPDDNLYFSSYPGGTGAKVNPLSKEIQRFALEQAEGMGSLGKDIYLGIYPGGRLYRLETEKPIKEGSNPEKIYDIKKSQDRPFVVTSYKDKVYVGTVPDYGRLGGGIAIYDPKTNSGETYAPIIDGHSISSLLAYEGILYGGTSIYGGLGIEPKEKHGLMFEWDIESKTLLKTFLPLPEAKNAPMISGFCLVGDLLYGAFDGILFAYDISLKRVVKYRNLYPQVKSYGRWRPVQTFLGSDGFLYSNLGGKITVIDPDSLDFQTLADSSLFALGKDNSIYYAKGWELYQLRQK